MQRWLERNKDIGILLMRLFVGLRLIYGVTDNIIEWDRMVEFSSFLQQFNFPLPLFSAIVSVYAQFIAGLMILAGWKIRIAALTMIINFVIALITVHINDSIEGMTPALAMLFACFLFPFYGAGSLSLEYFLQRKHNR